MKKYEIQQNGDNEMIIAFYFNKKSLIIPSIIWVSFLILIIFITTPEKFLDILFSLILFLLFFGYLLFEDYFEWHKHKYHILSVRNEDLYINNVFHCKLYKLQTINIMYLNTRHSKGWMVYLDVFPISSNDYIIKKRLREKEAHGIAEKISIFLDRNIKVES